ncbi:MAG: hypothetical protein QM784_14875 [Polyangiaceae bacterium]
MLMPIYKKQRTAHFWWIVSLVCSGICAGATLYLGTVGVRQFWLEFFGLAATIVVCGMVLARAFGKLSLPIAVLAYFFFYFVLIPIAQQLLEVFDYHSESLEGISLATQGVVAFSVGALLLRSFVSNKNILNVPVLEHKFDFLRRRGPIWAMLALGTISTFVAWRLGLASGGEGFGILGVLSSASAFLHLSITFSAALWMSTKARSTLIVLILSLLFAVVHGFLRISKGMMLVPFIDAALVFIVARQKFPLWLAPVLGLGYFLVVAPLVGVMRGERISSDLANESDFAVLASRSVQKTELGTSNIEQLYVILRHLDRAGPRMLGAIVETTGRTTPFENGGTYVWALQTAVPRFIWPEKPDMSVGNVVGHKYLVIAEDDEVTAISPGLIGEMYMNFGYVGAIFGMFVLGIVTVLIQEFLLRFVGTAGLAYFFTGYFFSQESAVAHCVIPSLKSSLLIYVGLTAIRFISDHCNHGFRLEAPTSSHPESVGI